MGRRAGPGLAGPLVGAPAYRILAIVVLGVGALDLVATSLFGAAGPPFAALLLVVLGGVLLGADRLARLGRAGVAAGGASVVLLVVAVVGGLLYPTRASSSFAPLIAFALLLPHLRGRQVPLVAAAAVGAAGLIATMIGVGTDPSWDPTRQLDVVLGAGGATGVVALILVRQRRDNEALIRSYSSLVEDLPLGVFRTAPGGELVAANETLVRLLGYPDRATLLAVPAAEILADPAQLPALQDAIRGPGFLAGEIDLRRFDGSVFPARLRARSIVAGNGTDHAYEGAIEDMTAERASHETAEQLAALVEAADAAIVGLRVDGTITSWNPAAERMYGWAAAEMVGGKMDRIVPPARRAELVELQARLAAGETVRAIETQRLARDGRTLAISLTAAPVVDPNGVVVGISTIERNVTEERRLQGQVERWMRERAAIIEALRRIEPGRTVDETAHAICGEIATTGGYEHAAIVAFEADGQAASLALWAQGRPAGFAPVALPARAEKLRSMAEAGPWIEDIEAAEWTPYRGRLRDVGVRDLAYVPIEFAGSVVGLLVAGTGARDRTELVERLPGLAEFGAIVAQILGPELSTRREAASGRARIRAVIDDRAFAPVFQPVVHLATGAVLGHEALSRFDDGTPPDRMFALAAASGLGLELEAATLEAALAASGPLPANGFLDLNVSPDLIVAVEPLRSLLARWGWGVILEITEHQPVADYEVLRSALRELGPGVRLAVDDAGAGFASLKHIVELRPAFVKLDRALVGGLEADKARQGLIAGMRHFADSIGCQIVAEGVERDEERQALLALGITMGQGYLFGQPRPVG